MSYPAFQSDAFPPATTQYRLPLWRPSRSPCTLVVFSVDWEKDHGAWRFGTDAPDYGGIIRGTRVLCDLLDELRIPCTWFVECNSADARLDMSLARPREFETIAARDRDEIGLHVHWGNHTRPDGRAVDLDDRPWVENEVRATTESLSRKAGRPIVSFRSGGHTVVPELPGILERLGYQFDGSVEDRRGSRSRRAHALFGITTDAYSPDRACACRRGDAAMIEVPTSLHLHDFANLQRAWPRLFPFARQRVISMYVHIDELTQPESGSDDEAVIDGTRLSGLRGLLERWRGQPRLQWVTAREASARLVPPSVRAQPMIGEIRE